MSADPLQLLDRLEPPLGWSARADLDADLVAARILERVVADGGNVISLGAARRRRLGVSGAVADSSGEREPGASAALEVETATTYITPARRD